ncbi:MAG: hypothetical protein AAF658_20215, partial [Myxococcota bacterium]
MRDWKTMRQQLLRSVVLLTVLSSGAVLGVAVYFAERGVETLSQSVIEQTTERTELTLERFFRPIEQELRALQAWGERGMLELDDPAGFLQLVQPFLESQRENAGLELTREDGAEIFILVESESAYALRSIASDNPTRARWTRFKRGRAVESWTETTRYNARTRPWFKGALGLESESGMFWTEPYTFFTTRLPGITAATRFRRGGKRFVVGVDLSLINISRFTTNLQVSDHGAVAVLTESGQTIGLPRSDRFSDPETLRDSMLKPVEVIGVPFLRGAIDAARELDGTKAAYRFQHDGGEWWGGTREYALSAERPLLIQAAVPESDLVGDLNQQRNLILLIIAASLLVAIGISYALGRRYEAKIEIAMSRAKQLGQYTLEKRIGSGGMGSVY